MQGLGFRVQGLGYTAYSLRRLRVSGGFGF